MITLVAFTGDHIRQMRKLYPDEVLGVGSDPESFIKELEVQAMAYTALEDGVPIGCAGIIPLWKGVGEAWACLTPAIMKKPMFLHRTVKKMLKHLQEKGRFHRIQCGVLLDFKVGSNWAMRLGFISEGPMYMYCPNKLNYRRFALLADF